MEKYQENFEFMKIIPNKSPIPKEDTLEYKDIENRSINLLKQILTETTSYKNIVKALKDYMFAIKKSGDKLIIEVGSQKFYIDNFDKPTLKNLVKDF